MISFLKNNFKKSGDTFRKIQKTLLLLIIFFLPTQLGKHFWPDFSIVSGLRIDYLSPTLYLTDILIIMLIAVGFIDQYTTGVKCKKLFLRLARNNGKTKSLIVFVIVVVLGILFSAKPTAGIYALVKLVEFFLFALVTVRLLKVDGLYKNMVFVFALSSIMQSALAIFQFVAQSSLGGIFYFLGERSFSSLTPGIANASLNGVLTLRPYGTLPHPNVLGGYLLFNLILSLSFFKNENSFFRKFILVVSVFLSGIGLLLAMSRSAIVVGAFIFIHALYGQLKARNRLLKSGVLTVLLIFVIGLSIPLASRFSTLNSSDEAFVQRKNLAEYSLQMFIDHPVFGAGINNFLILLPAYVKHNNSPIQPVHNIYLLVLTELGFAGFLFVSLLIINLIRKTLHRDTGRTIAYLLMVILLIGIFDHYFLTLQQGRLLLVLVLALAYKQNADFRPRSVEI